MRGRLSNRALSRLPQDVSGCMQARRRHVLLAGEIRLLGEPECHVFLVRAEEADTLAVGLAAGLLLTC